LRTARTATRTSSTPRAATIIPPVSGPVATPLRQLLPTERIAPSLVIPTRAGEPPPILGRVPITIAV
jgi:hypothetical protein